MTNSYTCGTAKVSAANGLAMTKLDLLCHNKKENKVWGYGRRTVHALTDGQLRNQCVRTTTTCCSPSTAEIPIASGAFLPLAWMRRELPCTSRVVRSTPPRLPPHTTNDRPLFKSLSRTSLSPLIHRKYLANFWITRCSADLTPRLTWEHWIYGNYNAAPYPAEFLWNTRQRLHVNVIVASRSVARRRPVTSPLSYIRNDYFLCKSMNEIRATGTYTCHVPLFYLYTGCSQPFN